MYFEGYSVIKNLERSLGSDIREIAKSLRHQ